MERHTFATALAALLTCGLASADVKITVNYNSDGQSSDTTIYANGTRLRFEYGKGLTLLRQCDANRMVEVDDKVKSYLIMPTERPDAAVSATDAPVAAKSELIDTKERKDMFGYPARHLKITEAADGKQRTETDGWYIDLKDLGCYRQELSSTSGGYPVSYTITTYGEKAKPVSTVNMKVTALVTAPLDRMLFEVPPGYTESTPQNTVRKVTQKAPGSVRIGAAALQNKSNQKFQNGAVYNQLYAQLQAAQLDVLPLAEGTPEIAQQKAREADCDYVLYTELASIEKPATGKVGGLLHKTPGIGHITGGDALEAHLTYSLVPAAGGSPVLTSAIIGKTGTAFDWKAAAMLASNMIPMAMAARMLGGAFNPGMMNAMLSGHGSGSAITSMDPMMNGLTMFLRATKGASGEGDPAPNQAVMEAALGAALDQVGKAVIAQLKRPTN